MADESVIKIEKASIYQGNKLILNDINITINKGEFVYLIGRTGSGKSSLLKTLYADIPAKKGVFIIAGYDLTAIKKKDIPFLRRKIGIIFQDFQLLFDRSVEDNLSFVLKATGWTDDKLIDKKSTKCSNLPDCSTRKRTCHTDFPEENSKVLP